jgi:hypothetical protein
VYCLFYIYFIYSPEQHYVKIAKRLAALENFDNGILVDIDWCERGHAVA